MIFKKGNLFDNVVEKSRVISKYGIFHIVDMLLHYDCDYLWFDGEEFRPATDHEIKLYEAGNL